MKNIKKVFVGTNTTNSPGRYALIKCVLQGNTLSVFDHTAASQGNETVDNLKKYFASLKKYIFPLNAYQRQYHYMI